MSRGTLDELAERLGNFHDSARALASCLQKQDVSRKTDHSMIEAAKCMFLSSAESEFYATGSATARGLQCKVYLSETERPCELDVYCDSTAGRGICQRTGVAKYAIWNCVSCKGRLGSSDVAVTRRSRCRDQAEQTTMFAYRDIGRESLSSLRKTERKNLYIKRQQKRHCRNLQPGYRSSLSKMILASSSSCRYSGTILESGKTNSRCRRSLRQY